jgi:hypothetical protein
MANVVANHVDATGTIVSGRRNLLGYQVIGGGTAGDIIFRDGGASGTVRLQFNISTGIQPVQLTLPADGILFVTDIHVTLPTSAKATVFTEAV